MKALYIKWYRFCSILAPSFLVLFPFELHLATNPQLTYKGAKGIHISTDACDLDICSVHGLSSFLICMSYCLGCKCKDITDVYKRCSVIVLTVLKLERFLLVRFARLTHYCKTGLNNRNNQV